jgi:hypothetical protein
MADYELPIEISVALSTDRLMFVDLWVKENPTERAEIGRLLKDLIADRTALKAQLTLLRERSQSAVGTLQAFVGHVEQIDDAINGRIDEQEICDD